MTIVNTAPTTSDGRVSTDEDTAYAFAVADFSFSDADGHALASVKVTGLPASDKGALTLDGMAVSVNQVVTKAELDDRMLVYTPPANANGNAYASFEFKVSDGIDESASSATMTIDVIAVNDPATGKPTISGTARVGEELTSATTGIVDLEGLDNVSWSYRWIRVDADGTSNPTSVGSDSSTYTLVAADAGSKLAVRVGFSDDAGNVEAVTSDAYPSVGTVQALPAVVVTGAEGLQTTEAGDKASFEVRLATQPSADVTVTPASSDTGEGTVSGALTFTDTNWSTAQTVTVTGVDDNNADGNQSYDITLRWRVWIPTTAASPSPR